RIFGRDNIDKEIVTALCSGPADEEYLHSLTIGLAERYGQEKVLLADSRGKARLYYTREALDPSGAPVKKGSEYYLGDLGAGPEKALLAFMARPGKRLFRISADERYSDSVADLCIGGYNRSRAFWILNPDRLRGMKGQPREQVAETVKQLKGLFYYYR
ncbi:MAG: hypothetical protein J5758_01960, partial [Abditibacteriota bacterium]|nr:hypothetical protein [Abditibacteriota bacterium]